MDEKSDDESSFNSVLPPPPEGYDDEAGDDDQAKASTAGEETTPTENYPMKRVSSKSLLVRDLAKAGDGDDVGRVASLRAPQPSEENDEQTDNQRKAPLPPPINIDSLPMAVAAAEVPAWASTSIYNRRNE